MRSAASPGLVRRRLPTVVIGSGFAIAAILLYPAGSDGVIAAFMTIVLTVVAATDLERRVIPNRIILPATAVVLLARLIFSTGRSPAFAVAALAGGLAFLAINLVSGPAMGMGDVKLVAFIGAGLGFGVVGAVVIAFLALFPFALGALARGGLAARKKTLPFGPFLAFGAIVVLLLPHVLGHAAT